MFAPAPVVHLLIQWGNRFYEVRTLFSSESRRGADSPGLLRIERPGMDLHPEKLQGKMEFHEMVDMMFHSEEGKPPDRPTTELRGLNLPGLKPRVIARLQNGAEPLPPRNKDLNGALSGCFRMPAVCDQNFPHRFEREIFTPLDFRIKRQRSPQVIEKLTM